MNLESKQKKFFKDFFLEFQQGLRFADQKIMDQLIDDLTEISLKIPPRQQHYSFREVLLLTSLIVEKKIEKLRLLP
ncbi:MAG: hypothetical protein ACXAC7_14410 [Candidatus Hodarchaeales archaeon]|jgi:hypothetical protein